MDGVSSDVACGRSHQMVRRQNRARGAHWLRAALHGAVLLGALAILSVGSSGMARADCGIGQGECDDGLCAIRWALSAAKAAAPARPATIAGEPTTAPLSVAGRVTWALAMAAARRPAPRQTATAAAAAIATILRTRAGPSSSPPARVASWATSRSQTAFALRSPPADPTIAVAAIIAPAPPRSAATTTRSAATNDDPLIRPLTQCPRCDKVL